MAEKESPETVAELIHALSRFEPTDFVVVREVFATEPARVLGVGVDRNRPSTVVITYDVAAE